MVVVFDAVHDFGGGEGAVIDGDSGADETTNEAYAGVAAYGWGGEEGARPVFVEQGVVDVVMGAVGVDIGAREVGFEKMCAVVGGGGEEVVDIMVFGGLEVVEGAGVVEIIGVVLAAVGAVEDDRQGGGFGFVDDERGCHSFIKR